MTELLERAFSFPLTRFAWIPSLPYESIYHHKQTETNDLEATI